MKDLWMLEQDRKTWGTMPLSAQREPCQVKAREGRYLKEERHLIVSFTHTPSRPSVHSDTDRQFPEVLLWWIKIRGHAALFSTTQLSFSNSYASFLTMAPSISIFLHNIFIMIDFLLHLYLFPLPDFLWQKFSLILFIQAVPPSHTVFSLPYFYCILNCNCSSVYLNRRNRIPNRERNMRKKKRVEWCHSSEVNGQYNRVTTTHVIHTVIIFWSKRVSNVFH